MADRSVIAKASIQARKAGGTYRNRQPEVDREIARRIMAHVERGTSPRRIGLMLDLAGVLPPRAAAWPRSTVRKVIARERGAAGRGA